MKQLALSAVFLVQAVLCGCGGLSSGSDTWGVIYTSLPVRISFDNIDEPAVSYVFRQTHEPLFRQEDGENFRSKVLLNWKRDINYAEYEFWPNTALKFNEGTNFSLDYFYSYIERVTAAYGAAFRATLNGDHVTVKFGSSQPGYLRFLTRYKNSPSVRAENGEEGLGAFSVKTVSNSMIELERKSRVPNGYNRIIIYPYGGPGDPNLQNRLISDFNKISSFQWPEWIKSEYRGFDNIELRVAGLAINHPDAMVRKALYNCIDVDEFRRAAIPARKDFYDVQTLLPAGTPGAKSGRPAQACAVPSGAKGRTVVFANPRSDNQKELAAFVERFNKKTGMRLTVKSFRPADMNPMLVGNKPRPFNLVIVVSDNPNRELEDFFKFYAGEGRAVDKVSPAIGESFRLLSREGFPEKKKILAEKLARQLADEWVALPLYQTTVKLYYPGKIKNINVGRGFVEDPDVADLRW